MDFWFAILTILFLNVQPAPGKDVPAGAAYTYDIPFESEDACQEFMSTDEDIRAQIKEILTEMDKSHGKAKYTTRVSCVYQESPFHPK